MHCLWKINIVCSNILTIHAYGIYIVQLIWYSWACVSYQNIIERLMLVTRKLLNHWFLELKLKSVTAYSSGAYVFPPPVVQWVRTPQSFVFCKGFFVDNCLSFRPLYYDNCTVDPPIYDSDYLQTCLNTYIPIHHLLFTQFKTFI